jgi:hypothetical protein
VKARKKTCETFYRVPAWRGAASYSLDWPGAVEIDRRLRRGGPALMTGGDDGRLEVCHWRADPPDWRPPAEAEAGVGPRSLALLLANGSVTVANSPDLARAVLYGLLQASCEAYARGRIVLHLARKSRGSGRPWGYRVHLEDES